LGNNFRTRSLSMRDQRARFRAAHPEFSTQLSGSRLVCSGRIQPTPLNNDYVVKITYEFRHTPTVDVEEPRLQRRQPDERIPHTYQGDRPCTFRPRVDWKSDQNLALIVPWVSIWLFSYEVWLGTGTWLFGGVNHTIDEAATDYPEGVQQ
jgi:hypothetical protein